MLDKVARWDGEISERLRLKQGKSINWGSAVFLAHSGDSWFWMIALANLWMLTRGFWRQWAVYMAFCIGVTALLVFAVKFVFKRTRPPGEWGSVYRKTDPHSFPSGHATRAFLIATLAFHLGPPWLAIILIIWAPLVALARVMTGLHFVLDVLVGALLGILAAYLFLPFLPQLNHLLPFLF